MSEFKKPTRVQISINKAFKELLNRDLVKDLHDNEEITLMAYLMIQTRLLAYSHISICQ